jgi:hypothetical protein
LVTDVGMPKRISKHALSFLIIQTHDVVDSELLRPHHERDIDSKPKKKKKTKRILNKQIRRQVGIFRNAQGRVDVEHIMKKCGLRFASSLKVFHSLDNSYPSNLWNIFKLLCLYLK